MREPFYLTTAIAYANAKPHIGFALELVYADVVARYQRLMGKDVRFLTGTDEHGQKILQKAEEAGMDPQAFTDRISGEFKDLAARLHITNTDFIRTTEARHVPASQEMWRRVRDAGFIYKKTYSGLYCVGCEAFKKEHELVDGKCPDHHVAPQFLEEENYFFKLSAFKERLQKLYADHPAFVVPEHKFNEVKQLVADLDESFDVSISRSTEQLAWGIPVPDDDTQVMYVWFDALVNYLTGAGFPSDDAAFARYWPVDVHIIGKEISRFHAMLWPAMCMAAGIAPPKQVAVHGWIHVDGQKMSKTLGNVIEPDQLIETYGVDATRYLLLSQVPFTQDGDWSHERSQQKYAADLANTIGNLVHRVTAMTNKYFDGLAPKPGTRTIGYDFEGYAEWIASYRFDQALGFILTYAIEQNRLIDETKPWELAKQGKQDELADVIASVLEAVRHIGWLIRPFMPTISDQILDRMGTAADDRELTFAEALKWNALAGDTPITSGPPIFPRLEETA